MTGLPWAIDRQHAPRPDPAPVTDLRHFLIDRIDREWATGPRTCQVVPTDRVAATETDQVVVTGR